MSEGKSIGGHSAACCAIPPVVASGYQAKGTYAEIDGKKTYVTGPDDATLGVLYIMDIFGFYDQTLQGADIISTSDPKKKYKVFVPNWYEKGEPADLAWFPPDNKDKEQKLGDFFGRNPAPKLAKAVPSWVEAMQKHSSHIKSWAVVGFCAGAKVATLSVQDKSTPFKVAAACHPAMVDPADAPSVAIPFALLASKDEPADQVKEFVDKLSVPKLSETYSSQIHGWMAARADLKDDAVRKEYERGYCAVVEFLGQHVS